MSQSEKLATLIKRAEELARVNNSSEEAVRINTMILELDDKISGSYTRLAFCFREQGKFDLAEEMYNQVLKFDPDNMVAQNGIQD